jgi:enamine deaminase RidA (YjgF/YER057c/UK114 family)
LALLLDGLEAQTEQAMRNVLAVLAEAGTGPEHVAKLTIYLATGVDPGSAYAATRSVWATAAPPSPSLLSLQRDQALSSRSRQ